MYNQPLQREIPACFENFSRQTLNEGDKTNSKEEKKNYSLKPDCKQPIFEEENQNTACSICNQYSTFSSGNVFSEASNSFFCTECRAREEATRQENSLQEFTLKALRSKLFNILKPVAIKALESVVSKPEKVLDRDRG